MKISIIYKHIVLYRMIMNILYKGDYSNRFRRICTLINNKTDKNITELCFGDIYIANHCKANGINWTGYDFNKHFVEYAIQKNHNAINANLINDEIEIKKADICIMIGSLYHFHPNIEDILKKMLQSSDNLIISEPIKNISSTTGFIGNLAKRLSNAGSGKESFRFNEDSFLNCIKTISGKLHFSYSLIETNRDILIVINKNKIKSEK